MDRRTLLTAFAAGLPAFALPGTLMAQSVAPPLRITDIKVARLRTVRDLGVYESRFHEPPARFPARVGGFTMTEIHTDQGPVGIGPGIDAQQLERAKERLIGRDPFDVGLHARWLQVQGRWGTGVEIALWDLVGKACNQPLAKLWGGGMDRVLPYGATLGIGDGVAERIRCATQVRNDGFKAVKMRSSFPTMREDIALIEGVRKALGDDFVILTDANKAGPYGAATQLLSLWDYPRAIETALAYQDLGLYWLEEPLGRHDYEGLARLRSQLHQMRLAGGEGNTALSEFRTYVDQGCYDILNTDCSVVGPTLYRQIEAMAFTHNRRVVPHAGHILAVVCHIHLAATQPQAAYGTFDLTPHMEVQHNPPFQDFHQIWSIFADGPKLDKEGYLPVPKRPGLGVVIPADLIEERF
ncbi:D-galactarolactone cycloisomerase [Hephaestia caeni]|uniref:D-galactarolactone cycloisomerase n=1 Tax=Hephaestia caeni TaxID=645617 RepID=A0A397NHT6_9SPHN|nr:mandelate racemase/muconate lactonizing enzyme family protein [Hephaestia caeni]RIA37096.1 D-galactarolactone cycloisomerase [Hephaestia caeni]